MIKVENGLVEAEGAPLELIKEWGELAFALCDKLTTITGRNVTLELLAVTVKEMASK